MLEDKYQRSNLSAVTDKAEAPLEDAVALMIREQLTGRPAPESARAVVDVWRDWIAERTGERFGRLNELIEDQRAFSRAMRDVLVAMEMAEELANERLAQLSVTEIAFRNGFNDPSHFSRAFRDRFGTTPGGYRAARSLA